MDSLEHCLGIKQHGETAVLKIVVYAGSSVGTGKTVQRAPKGVESVGCPFKRTGIL